MKNLGARPGDAPDRVLVGRTIFAFIKRDGSPPSAGGAIDHLGFSFADLDAKVKELESAGAKVLTPPRDVPNLFRIAFVEDPFGIKLELVQDAESLGFHHLHLRVADPGRDAEVYWTRSAVSAAKLTGLDG